MQGSTALPSFRGTHTRITAHAALASPILGNVFSSALHAGGFSWGFSFDVPGRRARIGAFNTSLVMRGTVGGGLFDGFFQLNEGTSNWLMADGAMVPYGRLEAVITATAARGVRVESLMTTLCDLLAGSNIETTPQAMWTRQPAAMAGTEPGYAVRAELAAVSAQGR